MKKKLLILARYYFPSVRAGGPVQSIKNLTESLKDKYDIYILCLNRDLGESEVFNVKVNEWLNLGEYNVYYTNKLNYYNLIEAFGGNKFDVIYLNSLFDFSFSILPVVLIKFKFIDCDRLIIATRGQLSKGALGLKSLKKKIFINFSRILKIYNNVVWHATSENERLEILKYFGSNVEIFKISNLSIKSEKLLYRKNICKKQGSLSIAFVSRIHPKKNLLYALSIVEKVKGEIEFNIVGPIEDKKYWSECEKKISKMPPNININYLGTVSNDLIIDEFRSNHVFLFPTLGENYGHVIIEAMLGGCPVIVSDQTPWKDLMSLNVGEDISLNNLENFTNSIQKYVGYNQEEYNHFSKNAFLYGSRCSSNKEYISEYINMFNINKEN